jgi:hypothetical protein
MPKINRETEPSTPFIRNKAKTKLEPETIIKGITRNTPKRGRPLNHQDPNPNLSDLEIPRVLLKTPTCTNKDTSDPSTNINKDPVLLLLLPLRMWAWRWRWLLLSLVLRLNRRRKYPSSTLLQRCVDSASSHRPTATLIPD